MSRATWNVTTSSCVMASTSGAFFRSLSLKSSSMPYRPVRSQSSAGWSTGISISCPPMPSISSRMIASTRLTTR